MVYRQQLQIDLLAAEIRALREQQRNLYHNRSKPSACAMRFRRITDMLPLPLVTVLYHADCLDGFGAAYAAWRHFGDTAYIARCIMASPGR